MNTKLTVLLASMCMSASVFAQMPASPATADTTPPNHGATTSIPNANAQLNHATVRDSERNVNAPENNRQNPSQQMATRQDAKMANAQRSDNVNCLDGAGARAPTESVANAGKHDNRLAKADCHTNTMQR